MYTSVCFLWVIWHLSAKPAQRLNISMRLAASVWTFTRWTRWSAQAYHGDRTKADLLTFGDTLAASAGQPHFYIKCAPTRPQAQALFLYSGIL